MFSNYQFCEEKEHSSLQRLHSLSFVAKHCGAWQSCLLLRGSGNKGTVLYLHLRIQSAYSHLHLCWWVVYFICMCHIQVSYKGQSVQVILQDAVFECWSISVSLSHWAQRVNKQALAQSLERLLLISCGTLRCSLLLSSPWFVATIGFLRVLKPQREQYCFPWYVADVGSQQVFLSESGLSFIYFSTSSVTFSMGLNLERWHLSAMAGVDPAGSAFHLNRPLSSNVSSSGLLSVPSPLVSAYPPGPSCPPLWHLSHTMCQIPASFHCPVLQVIKSCVRSNII